MASVTFKFEELRVYQKAIVFGEHINGLCHKFPDRELYSLSSQFRRAADSIALNIAEGYPGSDKQFVKHLNIAIYSANECVTCSTKAQLREYINKNEENIVRNELLEIIKSLVALRNKIKQRIE